LSVHPSTADEAFWTHPWTYTKLFVLYVLNLMSITQILLVYILLAVVCKKCICSGDGTMTHATDYEIL